MLYLFEKDLNWHCDLSAPRRENKREKEKEEKKLEID